MREREWWDAVLVLWGNFEQLLFFFAFANWLFFALVGLSVFMLRKKNPKGTDTYSMMGYPWVPALFILCSLFLCLVTIQSAPRESLFGALLLLSGLPIYWIFKERRRAGAPERQ